MNRVMNVVVVIAVILIIVWVLWGGAVYAGMTGNYH
jgi:hypothetical protein